MSTRVRGNYIDAQEVKEYRVCRPTNKRNIQVEKAKSTIPVSWIEESSSERFKLSSSMSACDVLQAANVTAEAHHEADN